MKDPEKLFNKDGKNAMGQFDRITSVKDLPADKILLAYIKEAAQLNEAGVKLPPKIRAPKNEIVIPDVLSAALNKHKKAKTIFENFPPSHKKEYIEWITEAKRDETRNKRIKATVERLLEGKSMHAEYQRNKLFKFFTRSHKL
jgi:uncharacterized protein YdeI (YjbR/CyaY-like superfamily)